MGSPASKKRVAINTDSPLNIIKRAAQNAIVIVAIDMKSVRSPITNFVGNDLRKSSSAYLDVSIPKNINTEAVDEKSANNPAMCNMVLCPESTDAIVTCLVETPCRRQ
ncbi:hypothetical protein G4B88_018938 [Cannabis sativa]|uniref:Uncharacterized protein n=1 Tax=Cannabis sativa TaxID=3483 RepID=A0A7J6H0W2_CANSA|nr:hypothetical protein G4B88_018938 [Cannabis sativa]